MFFSECKLSLDFSGLLSREGHCRRFGFRRFGLHVSISLPPLAPPALPGLIVTMGALTPVRRVLRFEVNMNAR